MQASETLENAEKDLNQIIKFVDPRNQKKRPATESVYDSASTIKVPKVIDMSRQPPIALSNRYSVLSLDDNDEATPQTARSNAPAPIIIPGRTENHGELVKLINTVVKKGFGVKYTSNNINIYVHHIEEKKALLELLQEKKAQYHTYSEKDEKTHAFVLRGLNYTPCPEPDDIKEEIEKTYNIKITKIYKMKATRDPLYLIITKPDLKLQDMQQKIKYLFYTRVQWERHVNKKIISQCHRCQNWGHATANCQRNPRCLKCAEEHFTHECTKSKDVPAKCVNCDGAHPANSVNCPTYLRKLQQRGQIQAQQRRAPPPVFVDAPVPAINAWTRRADAPPIPTTSASASVSERASGSASRQREHFPLLKAPRFVNSTATKTTPPTTVDKQQNKDNKGLEIVNSLKDLQNEVNMLNSLINFNNVILAVRDLNNLLKNCNNATDKFYTTINFVQNIEKYNI